MLALAALPLLAHARPIPTSTLRAQIVGLVNEERAKEGLAPLTYNRLLQRSAQGHAIDMDKRGFFSHQNPDGKRSKDRIKGAGYGKDCACNRYYGENIARGQTTAEQVVLDWMHSPSHRENIMSPDYRDIGIGIQGEYWVQNFGGVYSVVSFWEPD